MLIAPIPWAFSTPAGLETSVDTDWGSGPGSALEVQDKKVSAYQPHSAEAATFNRTISILCFNLFESHKLIIEEMRHKFDFSMQQFFSPFRRAFCFVSLLLCICFTFYITVAICLPDYLLQIQFPVAVQPYHTIFNPSYQLLYKPDAKNVFQINT